jgi:replicative DNA helicase
MEIGKLPPQSRELEEAILAAILLEGESIWKANAIITPECFYVDANAKIYGAMVKAYHSNEPIDLLTVTEILKANGELESIGGHYYIVNTSNKAGIGSAANLEYYCYGLKELYLKRKLITLSGNIMSLMYEDTTDFFDAFSKYVTEIDGINSEINRLGTLTWQDIVVNRTHELKEAGASKTYKTGVTTQLEALDRHTNGFQRTDLIIVAARPAMGKTALIIDFMKNQASREIPVGFLSLEMSSEQIVDRMLANESGIELEKVRKGGMTGHEWQVVDSSTAKLMNMPIYVCDKGGLGINDIVGIAKQWKLKHDIEILYIDYLQLISGTAKKNGNREGEISEISRRLKQLAKELKIPVIALSQLSRAVESRSDKRPMLSDLRESGAIEQDADMVIFPFRDEYYNDGAEKGKCELIIAKHRNGKTGIVLSDFNGELQRFTDYQNTF